MKCIDIRELLLFHEKIIDKTGGSRGARDLGLIESALNRAFVTFESEELYKNIEEKISSITYSLIKNHGFVDGNKRIGIAVMLLLLKINGIKIYYNQDELVKLGIEIADGTCNEENIKAWIIKHQKK